MTTYPIYKLSDLAFDELVEVKQSEHYTQDRPEVNNKWRKLLFFLLREGLKRTLSKIQSKKNKETLLKKYYTTITLSKDNTLYYNFSIQTTKNPEYFVIKNIFSKQAPNVISLKEKLLYNQFNYHNNNQEDISLPIAIKQKNEFSNYDQGVFIYGLGDYSRVYIAPKIKKTKKIFCVDYSYQLAAFYKKKYHFENYGLVPQDSYHALKKTKNPLAIIASYHSDHTRIAKEIYNNNPNTFLFIEKPPCVTLEDLKTLLNLYHKKAKIEIGYNRRYIPINSWIKERCFNNQKVINISVKEILINKSHWYFWENQGTRITGNLTHWIDLSMFWINGIPIELNVLSSPSKDETIAASILFSEGSLVNITVSDKGNSLRGVQEFIEIRTEEETFVINDYISLKHIQANGKKLVKKYLLRKKGHDFMYKNLLKTYQKNETIKYNKEDLIKTTLTAYRLSEMFKQNLRTLNIEDEINSFLNL